jgi:hypothetical protein
MVQASIGGPLVQAVGLDVPTPILTLGGAHGIRDDAEATARVDATAAAFGVLHVEPGVAYHPLVRDAGWVPSLTVAGSLHLLTDFEAVRAGPLVTGVGAWRVGGRHLLYAGADVAAVFGNRQRVLAGPLVGGELRLGHVGLGLEAKWLAPYYDVGPTAPEWLSPADRGYLSVLIGFHYYLGDPP